MLIIAK